MFSYFLDIRTQKIEIIKAIKKNSQCQKYRSAHMPTHTTQPPHSGHPDYYLQK